MAPLPDVAKTVKVALVLSDGINTDIVTRFYVSYSGGAPSSADLDTFGGSIMAAWSSNVAGAVHEDYALIRVECTDLTTPTSAIGLWAGTEAGTATGAIVPASAAVVASYTISRRYRGGHPRGYWLAGIAADMDDPQHWTSGFIASMQGALEAFFTAVLGAGWGGAGTLDHVNVSYYHGFTVITNPVTGRARNVPTLRGTPVIDSVVALVARLRIGTQRRRVQYR